MIRKDLHYRSQMFHLLGLHTDEKYKAIFNIVLLPVTC